MSTPIRIQIHIFFADPDSMWVNIKEEKLKKQQIFIEIFQNDIKKSLQYNKPSINLSTVLQNNTYFYFSNSVFT